MTIKLRLSETLGALLGALVLGTLSISAAVGPAVVLPGTAIEAPLYA